MTSQGGAQRGMMRKRDGSVQPFDAAKIESALLRADQQTLLDVAGSINKYLEERDWRIHANANQGYSLGGLILNVSGKMIANYWLHHVYPPEVGAAHRSAALHIHDPTIADVRQGRDTVLEQVQTLLLQGKL